MRKAVVIAGAVLSLVGLVLALAPFRIRIPLGEDGSVHPRCPAPAASAWHRGPKDQLQLWAVTAGTDKSGYEVRSGVEPWCGEKARPRLAAAVAFLVAGAAVAFLGLRRTGKVSRPA